MLIGVRKRKPVVTRIVSEAPLADCFFMVAEAKYLLNLIRVVGVVIK